jgi:DNA-directed RNA polymerase III subunit RPC1
VFLFVGDVWPGPELTLSKNSVVGAGYAKCDAFIQQFNNGELATQPGCDPEQSLEAVITTSLSAVSYLAFWACLYFLVLKSALACRFVTLPVRCA